MKLIRLNRKRMKKFTREELQEVLPVAVRETKELTKSQKLVLGQLMILNGLDKKDADGFFYRSNLDLCIDCGIKDEHTLIAAVRKLVYLGFIERKTGARRTGASLYKVLEDRIKDYCNSNTGISSNDMLGRADRIKEQDITVKNLNRNSSNNSSTDKDKDIEIDKDIELLINKILKITSKEILINILNSVLEKQEQVRMAESAIPVSQDSQASAPSEDVPQASPVKEQDAPTQGEAQGTPVETETPAGNDTLGATESPVTPVEEEQYQQGLQYLEPVFNEYTCASSIPELYSLLQKAAQTIKEFRIKNQIDNDNLISRLSQVAADRYCIEEERIEAMNQQLTEIFKSQGNALS